MSFRLIAAAALLSASLATPVFAQPSQSLKIGMIGAGNIGGPLARLWARAGYKVMISARKIDEVKALAADIGPNVTAGTPDQAAAFGDVVVIAVPFGAIPQIGRDYAAQLKGKVVLDTSNPKGKDYLALTPEQHAQGSGIVNQALLPGTRLVKAFNTVKDFTLLTGSHAADPVGVPLASDDQQALEIAKRLVMDAGYEPVVAGGLASAQIFDSYTPFHTTGMPAREVKKLLIQKPPAVFTE